MNRKLKIAIASILLITITLSVTYAAIIAYKQVPMTMRVKMTATIGVFDTDGHSNLTSINLGDFSWYDNYYFPGKVRDNMPPQPAPSYYINNTDQTTLYVQFVAPQIANVTFAIWIKRMDSAEWISLHDGQIYQLPLTSPSLDPTHPLLHAAQWYLQVSINQPAFGSYSPVLTFNGVDSP